MSEDKVRDALHWLPYGFYAIGTRSDDEVNIMVATWLTQSSFEPRQITLALQKTAYSHGLIAQGQVFSVNVFDKDGAEILKQFTRTYAKHPEKVSQAKFSAGAETGCPIVEGAAAYLECRVVNTLDSGGDHDLIVGEVVGGGVTREGDAANTLTLVDIGWDYAG